MKKYLKGLARLDSIFEYHLAEGILPSYLKTLWQDLPQRSYTSMHRLTKTD